MWSVKFPQSSRNVNPNPKGIKILKRHDQKRTSLLYIILKNTKGTCKRRGGEEERKRGVLKAVREKHQPTYKGRNIRTLALSSGTLTPGELFFLFKTHLGEGNSCLGACVRPGDH